MNSIRLLDHRIFFAINNLSGKNSFFDGIGRFLAGNIFVALWCLVIVAIWFFSKNLRKQVYVAVVSAGVSRFVIVEIIKRLVDRQRPYEALANIHKLIVDNEHGMAFPSGHAVVYFSFAFAFWKTKYFWPFFILACIASLDRVYVGVHYPFDILASFFIAWATVWIVKRLFKTRFLS
jgi:undecaprenyl-diphosphatase